MTTGSCQNHRRQPTTGSIRSFQHLKECNETLVRWKFAIHKLLWWHFQVGWASGLQFIFFWDNVNNQKYIWIILSKMTGELDKSVRFSCQIFSVFYMPTPSLSSQQTACELWWLSGGKGGILSELQAVLCTTVVHSGMRTNMSSSWIYF